MHISFILLRIIAAFLVVEPCVSFLLMHSSCNEHQLCPGPRSREKNVLPQARSDGDEDLFHLIADKNANEKDELYLCDVKDDVAPGEVLTPRDSFNPDDIAPLLMNALQNNDFPQVDAGITAMWEFSTDTTKYIFQNNITEFIESCHETADEFPTSFYGVALHGKSWKMITDINRVGGENGWIATQIMETISSDGRLRRWQWELRKNKRPPCLGCWKVETIGSSDRQGNFQTEGRGTGWEV